MALVKRISLLTWHTFSPNRVKKVLVVDADLGLNNIDILLGLNPSFHIGHVLSGEKNVQDIITEGPAGIHLLPAGGGLQRTNPTR